MPTEIAPGLVVETVGDLLGEAGVPPNDPAPVSPPTLPGAPTFPEPGIYFGMPEDVYHAIHACSASGLKALSTSSMDYWAKSVLNPDRGDDDSVFKAMGRAYHCRICEGREAFAERYAVGLDKADYPSDWPDDEDDSLPDPLPLCVTVAHIRRAIDLLGGKPKGTAKEPLIEQLQDLDPTWPIWDAMVKEHEEANAGKEIISATLNRRIEIAAAMIANDPQLRDAFTGGYPEVALFWYDKATGVPMKAKLDYLKLMAFVDLKSFSNRNGKPIQRAIDGVIANDKHYLPVVVYSEGIAAVKELVREMKGACVFAWVNDPSEFEDGTGPLLAGPELTKWCWQWAHQPEPDALYVYQQTGQAPVTRGRIMRRGATYDVTQMAVQWLKRKWLRCAETYGTDPWLDIEPITVTVDENLNSWTATEFGENETDL